MLFDLKVHPKTSIEDQDELSSLLQVPLVVSALHYHRKIFKIMKWGDVFLAIDHFLHCRILSSSYYVSKHDQKREQIHVKGAENVCKRRDLLISVSQAAFRLFYLHEAIIFRKNPYYAPLNVWNPLRPWIIFLSSCFLL